jgi:NADPH-dependent ferric siderophore reductase
VNAPAGPGRGRRRPAPLRAVVQRREQLSPNLVRVGVTGAGFEAYQWPGPAAHFKLMIPEPGAVEIVLPEPAADGTVDFAAGPVPLMRTYTARRFDPDTRILDIDIVLHGDGPVAAWAQRVQTGDQLAVSRPRAAGFTEDPTADWVLLAGDSSALPAIASIAETLTLPSTILLHVAEPADRIDIARPVRWVEGTGAADTPLEQAVADFVAPAGRGQIWVAGEAGAIRRIRNDLTTRFDGTQLMTRGYWRAGTTNHPDHDYGLDDSAG